MTSLGHAALIVSGVITHPASVPALAGRLTIPVIAGGIAARHIYEASKATMHRVADKIKPCIGPHCRSTSYRLNPRPLDLLLQQNRMLRDQDR
jgi:hypothetical protein